MFVYTVYGVTGGPGRAQSRRVEPVSQTTPIHPTTRSWVTQQSQEQQRHVYGIQPTGKQQAAETPDYSAMLRSGMGDSPKAGPKQSTSLSYLENASSLVVSYRRPKSLLSPNFSGHIEKLAQMRRELAKPQPAAANPAHT